MKKILLPAFSLFASVLAVQAQASAPTNLMVMRLGGVGQSLATSGNTMNLDEYTTTGTLVSTVVIPSSGTNAFICGGTSATEGYISLSANGKYLVWAGYNTNYGWASTSLSTSSGAAVARGVATLDGYGNYALAFTGNVESGSSIRGGVSDGLGNFWIEGGVTGIIYVGNNGPLATVSTSTANERCLNIFNGNLYYSTGSAAGTSPGLGLWEVPGLPTTAGGNNVNTNDGVQFGTTSPEDFVVNPTAGLAYLCDDDASTAGGGIIRYKLTGGIWVSNYTISTGSSGAYSVVANFSGANPVLYATVGGTSVSAGNTLVSITDTGSNSTPGAIAVAPAGYTFRGLSWAPGAYPLITNQPASGTNDYTQTSVLSVGVEGTAPFGYQWYSNSAANPTFVQVAGATGATLTLSNLVAAQSNSMYYVVVTNAYGTVTSAVATLTVDPPGPPINVTVTPSSTTVNAGSATSFTVNFAGGTSGLSYGWRHNGTPLANGSLGGSIISGANTGTLTISNALATDDGSYTAYVTNSFSPPYGVSAVPGVLSVTDPAIVTNVMGATNIPGNGPVHLSITAIGTGLTYQWLSNGVVISGATSSNYTAPNQTAPISTSYSVIVTSTDGSSVTNGPALVAFSYLILQENFNYPNGSDLFTDVGSPWTVINSTLNAPEIIYTNTAQVSSTNATTDSQDLFNTNVLAEIGQTGDATGIDGVYWVSFTVNLSSLPTTPGGVYFANLEDKDYNFYGRIFALTSNTVAVADSGNGFPASVPTVAYPGTYRLGISDSQGDYAVNEDGSSGPTAVVPLDLAPGITYTVVYALDYLNLYSRMAINPSSEDDVLSYYAVTGVSSGAADDAFDNTTSPPLGYGLRQRAGEGTLYVGNIKVASEPSVGGNNSYYGYGYVTAGITPSNPVIGLQPVGTTNYLYNPFLMEVAASGIGAPGVGLTYAWYKNTIGSPGTYTQISDGGDITGSATPAIAFSSLAASDAGTYYVKVTGTAGTTQSGSTVISLNTTPTAASFTLPGAVNPSGTPSVSEGTPVTLTGTAVGTGPITYQWYFNSGSGYSSVYGPSSSPSYTFQGQPALSGSYELVATGGYGSPATSSVTVLTVTGPLAVTIGYLRNLQDYAGAPTMVPSTGDIGDGTALYQITGVVTTFESLTSGNTSSYYLQDSTGGMNLFISGTTSFLPAAGDIVSASGTLEEYNNNLELDLTAAGNIFTDLTQTDPVHYPNQALPAPQLLPWGYVAANANSVTVNSNLMGSRVYLTNVYFEVTNGTTINSSDTTYLDVTNSAGVPFIVFSGDSTSGTNLNGFQVPAFASTVTGILALYTTNYVVIITSTNDIVPGSLSGPSGPITNLGGTASGGTLTLTWTAVPTTGSYSVLYSTNVQGPYTTKLATGLTFPSSSGHYTTTPTNTANFYEISSP